MYEGISELRSADDTARPRTAAFAKYCFGLAGADGLVPASRFELKAIHKLSPYILVARVVDNGADFLVRHTGTKLAAEFLSDNDPTGSLFSETLLDDAFSRRTWYIVRQAVHLKRPVLNQPGRTWLRDKDYMTFESVTFPLVDDAGDVAKVASINDFSFESDV
jgi:hypothetical protein